MVNLKDRGQSEFYFRIWSLALAVTTGWHRPIRASADYGQGGQPRVLRPQECAEAHLWGRSVVHGGR